MIRIILVIGALFWTSAAIPQNVTKTLPEFIGTASMSDDGTVTLHLTRSGDGQYANSELRYTTDDPKYGDVLKHIGGLKPGETKPVRPWPDD
jgi:hypothetical protein